MHKTFYANTIRKNHDKKKLHVKVKLNKEYVLFIIVCVCVPLTCFKYYQTIKMMFECSVFFGVVLISKTHGHSDSTAATAA